jgi:hypothetical protein
VDLSSWWNRGGIIGFGLGIVISPAASTLLSFSPIAITIPNRNPKFKQPPSEHDTSTLLQATRHYILMLGMGAVKVLENAHGVQF